MDEKEYSVIKILMHDILYQTNKMLSLVKVSSEVLTAIRL